MMNAVLTRLPEGFYRVGRPGELSEFGRIACRIRGWMRGRIKNGHPHVHLHRDLTTTHLHSLWFGI